MNYLEGNLDCKGNNMHFDDIRNTVVCCGSAIGSAIIAAFGGPHMLLSILIWFIVLDYATGVGRAFYTGKCFDGQKAMKGLWKKLMYFLAILFAVQLDRLMGIPEVGLDTGGKIRITTLIILSATEASSVLRNLGACGITLPEWIKQAVAGLTKSGGNGKDNNSK